MNIEKFKLDLQNKLKEEFTNGLREGKIATIKSLIHLLKEMNKMRSDFVIDLDILQALLKQEE